MCPRWRPGRLRSFLGLGKPCVAPACLITRHREATVGFPVVLEKFRAKGEPRSRVRRCRTLSAFDRWLGAQGLFDALEMSATMHGTPQDARLPPTSICVTISADSCSSA